MPNSKAQQAVASSLDTCTSNKEAGLQGVVFVAVDKDGKVLAQHASGNRSLTKGNDKMSMDTVFWIASCTKFLTTIAAMQLVEQGKIGLDDAQALYKICPELDCKQVYDAEEKKLRPRKGDITLRKLLAHTAGFGYEFFDQRLVDYGKTIGKTFDAFNGDVKEYTEMPLMNDPDVMWEYGIGIDWAGIVVERLSGMTLDAYFEKYIMEPVGLKNITFFPNEHMREHIVTMLQRDPEGKTKECVHLYKAALDAVTPEEQSKIFNSGGAGCFGKPAEYVQILAVLLNGGVSAKTGSRILEKDTIDHMWENQIPQFPNFARGGPPPADPSLANALPEFYPQGGNPPQGWGLSMFLTIAPGETGRGANTAWWAGISNQFWWCDREKGVAGMICGQVLPFGDMQVIGQWIACEKAVYDALSQAQK